MEDLLKELGYTDVQIRAIIDGMRNKKIFTSNEENIDTRYQKLKEQSEAKEKELTTANELVKALQESARSNNIEDMKSKISNYEKTIEQLQEENKKEKIKNQLSLALKDAKAIDEDYIAFKIGQQLKAEQKELELDENGKIKGINDLIEAQKKAEPNFFTSEAKKEVEVKEIGKGQEQGNNEPKNLKEALMQQYNEKTGKNL